jgi:hypothetical protein
LEASHKPAQVCALAGAGHVPAMVACLDWAQVNLMRFSALFQSDRRAPAGAAGSAAPRDDPAAGPQPAPAAPELPEDLDARVRLLGEWQVSEH